MPIDNPYSDNPAGPQDFGRSSRLVSPSDSEDLAVVSKGVMVAAEGDVTLIPVNNADADTVVITSAPAGLVLPWFTRRVKATGTTATLYTIED